MVLVKKIELFSGFGRHWSHSLLKREFCFFVLFQAGPVYPLESVKYPSVSRSLLPVVRYVV